MFYITTTANVGPNQSEEENNYGEPTATISTTPPRTNMSGEIRANGWLGQNGDWTKHAWGEFETVEAARAFCWSQGWTEPCEDEDAESVPSKNADAYTGKAECSFCENAAVARDTEYFYCAGHVAEYEIVTEGTFADECYTTERAKIEHWHACDWFNNEPDADLDGTESGEQIEALADKYQSEAMNDGVELHGLEKYLLERRDIIAERNEG